VKSKGDEMEITETNRPAVQEREYPRPEPQVGIARSTDGSTRESDIQFDEPTHEEISVRAYYYWLDRGSAEGLAEQDWQQAEQELRAENARLDKKSKTAAASSKQLQ
jgi:Protein of unknown function (DUF2934)